MKLLKQPNQWSCLPTSLAMCLDVGVDKIVKLIGNDGSEILYPELEEPRNRRCFSMTEMIDVAYRFNYAMVPIDGMPTCGPSSDRYVDVFTQEIALKRLCFYLERYKGIIIGELPTSERHAVAWDNNKQKIYDPNGTIYDLEDFVLETFWMLISYKIINGFL